MQSFFHRFAPIVLACFTMVARGQFKADLDLDGFKDRVLPDECGTALFVVSGSTGNALLALEGTDPRGEYHAAFGFLGDITGDGIPDVVVFSPAAEREGALVGRMDLFSGADGTMVWSAEGLSEYWLFPGAATIPDQTNDGQIEIIARAIDPANPRQERSIIINGATGARLKTGIGAFTDYARTARSGGRVFLASDLTLDDLTDPADIYAFTDAASTGNDDADLNTDGVVDFSDLQVVLGEQGAFVPPTPQSFVGAHPDGSRMALTESDAQLLLLPDDPAYSVFEPLATFDDPTDDDIPYDDGCDDDAVDVVVFYSLEYLMNNGTSPIAQSCTDRRPRPGHTPSANGCGSSGISNTLCGISPWKDLFTQCCNDHDRCYDTCNSDRGVCDNIFLICMAGRCDNLDNWYHRYWCQRDSAAYYYSVRFFGGGAYSSAQENACICCDEPNPAPECDSADPPEPTCDIVAD